jgi:hypothetical protein
MRFSVGVAVIAGVALAAPPAAKKGPKLLSASEIVKLVKASPRKYDIDSEQNPYPQWRQQNALVTWPESHPPVPMVAYKTLPDGARTPVPYTRPQAIDTMLEEVEPLFEAKDYAGAEKGYEKILAKFPDEYSVQIDWGDSALFAGNAKVALERYEKATKLNPADHRSWYYRGNALAALGRKKEAIDAWVHAIAMRPENTIMLTGLEQKASALGYVVRPRSFMPAARVATTSEGAKITAVVSAQWLGWGLCKAMWRAEPSHRKAITGSETDTFSILEEKECLMALASGYSTKKKGESADPVVERLLAAIDADVFHGYLVYEIASRVEPHVYLMQTPELQRQIEAYVRKFILVPE